MGNPITWIWSRLTEWWMRTSWGWLVIIGPIIAYLLLFMALDFSGLNAANPVTFTDEFVAAAAREPDSLGVRHISARLEYALVAVLLFIISVFSILWALPKVLSAFRNPFGGLTGLVIAVGLSGFLYWVYLGEEYNLRQALADDLLISLERQRLIGDLNVVLNLFGLSLPLGAMTPSEIMSLSRDFVYLFSGAAPWFLIVLAARCASFEPRRLYDESHASLRRRLMMLQMAVILAAGVLVLSVAYTRAMVAWPTTLFIDTVGQDFSGALFRYVALWGALGTVMLITALTPAYVSLLYQFDRVATHELTDQLGRAPTYQERLMWRAQHGLQLSTQQVLTTGAAVVAPLITSPALDASGLSGRDDPRGGAEIRLDQNLR